MKCEKVRTKLTEYLADSLTEVEKSEVRAHLDTCIDCRGELAFVEQIRCELQALPRIKAPAGLPGRIHERLAALEAKRTSPMARLFRIPGLAGLVTTIVALVLITNIYFLSPRIETGESSRSAAKNLTLNSADSNAMTSTAEPESRSSQAAPNVVKGGTQEEHYDQAPKQQQQISQMPRLKYQTEAGTTNVAPPPLQTAPSGWRIAVAVVSADSLVKKEKSSVAESLSVPSLTKSLSPNVGDSLRSGADTENTAVSESNTLRAKIEAVATKLDGRIVSDIRDPKTGCLQKLGIQLSGKNYGALLTELKKIGETIPEMATVPEETLLVELRFIR